MRLLLCFITALAFSVVSPAKDFDTAAAVNQLGLDLYRQLSREKPDTNLVLSPYSIGTALALAYTGAEGATRAEMARVLHFPSNDLALQTSLGTLRTQLATAASYTNGTDHIEWHQANRLYAARDLSFREDFLTRLKDGYDSALERLDFQHDSANARLAINRWVEAQTRDRIRDLIPEDGVDPATRLVLVNALYFKAPWTAAFDKDSVKPMPFHTPATDARSVSTMNREAYFGYRHAQGVTTVVLPYLEGDFQFVIFLPDEKDGLEAAAARLTPGYLKTASLLRENHKPTLVRLYLPKFSLSAPSIELSRILEGLGMKQAFDQPAGSADFSRIAATGPSQRLSLSEVFHQTFLAVDENGTEAAAATASEVVTLSASASRSRVVEVHVDHPFLFAIQHRSTGLCLFLGRITDPR